MHGALWGFKGSLVRSFATSLARSFIRSIVWSLARSLIRSLRRLESILSRQPLNSALKSKFSFNSVLIEFYLQMSMHIEARRVHIWLHLQQEHKGANLSETSKT